MAGFLYVVSVSSVILGILSSRSLDTLGKLQDMRHGNGTAIFTNAAGLYYSFPAEQHEQIIDNIDKPT